MNNAADPDPQEKTLKSNQIFEDCAWEVILNQVDILIKDRDYWFSIYN